MRYIKNTVLYTSLFVLTIQLSFAQNQLFEKKFYSSTWQSVIHEVIPADSASWIIAGYRFDCDNGFLARIDSSGEIVWETFLGGYSQFTDVIALSDGNYLAAGFKFLADDVSTEFDASVVFKFDINGNVMFETGDSTYFNGQEKVSELVNGKIFLAKNKYLIIYNPFGDSLSKDTSLIGAYHDIVADGNRLLAGTEAGIATLDSNGNLTQFIPYQSPVKNVGLVGDTAYMISNETSLIVLGKGLEDTILVKDLSTFFSSIKELEIGSNYYIVHGIEANGDSPLMHMYDMQHNLKSTLLSAFDEYLQFGSMALADSFFALTGMDILSPGGHAYIRTFDYGLNAPVHEVDLAISNLEVDYTEVRFITSPNGNGGIDSTYEKIYYLNVDIENVGNISIDSFYLQSPALYCSNCSKGGNVRIKGKARVNPNEIITIDSIVVKIRLSSRCFWSNSFCLSVFSPNDLIDNDKSNNKICKEIFTSVPEVISEQNVIITPNPFSDFIQLQTDVNIDYLELYNTAGRRVLVESNLRNSHQIHTEQLPAGIYILKAGNQESFITRKLVKVD